MSRFAPALLLTLIAGLATGLGGAMAVFVGRGKRFLPLSLGFSAGVMLYLSFVELYPQAQGQLMAAFGNTGKALAAVSFFIGVFIIALLDKLIPEPFAKDSAHFFSRPHGGGGGGRMGKLGALTAVSLTLHNFPEGVATFASSLRDPRLGLILCVSIAIHNIPEGVAVATPIYHAYGSKKKAVKWAFLSGLSEPLGAVAGMLFLWPYLEGAGFGMLLGAVAGIMVFLSLDELLPTAREYGQSWAVCGLIGGMAVMAATLSLL